MEIQLQSETVELLQRASLMLNVHSYDEVIVRAVSDTLEQADTKSNGHSSSENLIDRFRRFRGTLQDVTVDDIAAMRHEGLR